MNLTGSDQVVHRRRGEEQVVRTTARTISDMHDLTRKSYIFFAFDRRLIMEAGRPSLDKTEDRLLFWCSCVWQMYFFSSQEIKSV